MTPEELERKFRNGERLCETNPELDDLLSNLMKNLDLMKSMAPAALNQTSRDIDDELLMNSWPEILDEE